MKIRKEMCILTILLVVGVLVISIGYGAHIAEISLSGEVTFETIQDMRILNVRRVATINDALMEYEENTKDQISLGFNLPNLNSSITYEIQVLNLGNTQMRFDSVSTVDELYNNSNIVYELEDIEQHEVIEKSNVIKSFAITFKYKTGITSVPENQTLNCVLKFNFEPVVQIDELSIGEYVKCAFSGTTTTNWRIYSIDSANGYVNLVSTSSVGAQDITNFTPDTTDPDVYKIIDFRGTLQFIKSKDETINWEIVPKIIREKEAI